MSERFSVMEIRALISAAKVAVSIRSKASQVTIGPIVLIGSTKILLLKVTFMTNTPVDSTFLQMPTPPPLNSRSQRHKHQGQPMQAVSTISQKTTPTNDYLVGRKIESTITPPLARSEILVPSRGGTSSRMEGE